MPSWIKRFLGQSIILELSIDMLSLCQYAGRVCGEIPKCIGHFQAERWRDVCCNTECSCKKRNSLPWRGPPPSLRNISPKTKQCLCRFTVLPFSLATSGFREFEFTRKLFFYFLCVFPLHSTSCPDVLHCPAVIGCRSSFLCVYNFPKKPKHKATSWQWVVQEFIVQFWSLWMSP